MKVQSTINPDSIWIRYIRYGKAVVRLRKNIIEIQKDEDIIYEYDEMEITVVDRENLEDYIIANFNTIFDEALIKENTPILPTNVERIATLEEIALTLLGI